jgi:hypothetical protein
MLPRSLYAALLMITLGLGFWAISGSRAEGSGRAENTPNAGYRQAIRQTPILERPSRPGHFYGNTVRRLSGVRSTRG